MISTVASMPICKPVHSARRRRSESGTTSTPRSLAVSMLAGSMLTICLGTLLSGAHAASESTSSSPPSPPAAQVSPSQYVALPASQTLIDKAIAGLDQVALDVFRRSQIPGMAVAVVHEGKTVFAKGYGLRRIDADAAIDPETVFLLASLSKPIGATVVATQVAQEKVSWSTPVRELLPWFRLSDAWVSEHVTIGDLYAHRSGLPDHAGDDLEDIGYERDEILRRLRFMPLKPFRAHYAYTNFGLTAAAQAVAQAAGTDWATLSQKSLYAPLGMQSTSSRHADYLSRGNRASGHVLAADSEHYVVSDQRQPDAQSPAGGVSSSVNDVAKWMAMVLQSGRFEGQTIVSEDALLPAITPKMITSQPEDSDARAGAYGYGFNVSVQPSGRVMLGHSGAFALGAGTTFAMIPSMDLGIVVLTNAAPVGAAEAVTATFMDLAQFGHTTRDWFAGYRPRMAAITAATGELVGVKPPVSPVAAQPAKAYLGTFNNDYFGRIEVIERDGALTLLLGPDKENERLTHWDGNIFTYQPLTENAPSGSISMVSFDDFVNGQAKRVTIENLNKDGLGVFLR